MAKGGKREGAGRKPKPKIAAPPLTKSVAVALYADPQTKQRWETLRNEPDASLRFQVEREISHQAGHKPVHNINHMHDKPVELNVTLSIAEVVRKVRERKEEYERNR